MDDVFADFNSIDWRTWKTLYALDSLGEYWKENERLIADAADIEELINQPEWTPSNQEEYDEYRCEINTVRHLHDEIMLPNFRYSILVMLYSVFERELLRLKSNVEATNGKAAIDSSELRGNTTDQVLRYLNAFYEINLKSSSEFSKIKDMQKVRDCLVHCAGDVELSRNQEYLTKFAEKRSDLEISAGSPIELGNLFISHSLSCVWRFFIDAFEQLNWDINKEWMSKEWG